MPPSNSLAVKLLWGLQAQACLTRGQKGRALLSLALGGPLPGVTHSLLLPSVTSSCCVSLSLKQFLNHHPCATASEPPFKGSGDSTMGLARNRASGIVLGRVEPRASGKETSHSPTSLGSPLGVPYILIQERWSAPKEFCKGFFCLFHTWADLVQSHSIYFQGPEW